MGVNVLQDVLRDGRTDGQKDSVQVAEIVTFIKSLRLRWYGHVERMQTNDGQNKLQQLQWEIQGKEDHVKDRRTRLKRI
jgi:thiamine biosynthesis protein ThiC